MSPPSLTAINNLEESLCGALAAARSYLKDLADDEVPLTKVARQVEELESSHQPVMEKIWSIGDHVRAVADVATGSVCWNVFFWFSLIVIRSRWTLSIYQRQQYSADEVRRRWRHSVSDLPPPERTWQHGIEIECARLRVSRNQFDAAKRKSRIAAPGSRKSRRRGRTNPDVPTPAQIDELRQAIRKAGKTASPSRLKQHVILRRATLYAGLRFLDQKGEYKGFKRQPKSSR
jgi:hypothetical protein